MRHRLVKVRVIVDGAIRSRLALYGRRISRQTSADLMRSRVLAELASLKAEEGIDLSEDVKPLLAVAHSLRKYVTELDKRLEKKAKRHPVCKRLMEVTGVGPICALSFYSAIDDPHRFTPASGVAAYLGLAPRRYQSGDVSYTTGITKTGNSLTRSHLVTAAMVFASRGPDSELKAWATALRERIGGPRSRIALARKLSIILLTMWKTGAKFEPYPSGPPVRR
jgi:transposase